MPRSTPSITARSIHPSGAIASSGEGQDFRGPSALAVPEGCQHSCQLEPGGQREPCHLNTANPAGHSSPFCFPGWFIALIAADAEAREQPGTSPAEPSLAGQTQANPPCQAQGPPLTSPHILYF